MHILCFWICFVTIVIRTRQAKLVQPVTIQHVGSSGRLRWLTNIIFSYRIYKTRHYGRKMVPFLGNLKLVRFPKMLSFSGRMVLFLGSASLMLRYFLRLICLVESCTEMSLYPLFHFRALCLTHSHTELLHVIPY